MKIATYAYKTTNIGDDFQAFAIEELLGKKTEKVYRDYSFRQKNEVALIANSWYMVKRPLSILEAKLRGRNIFPPPNCVNPLYIGISIGKNAKKYMLSNKGLEHLRRHQPIGCRDTDTLELLQKYGLQSYFSGCPTMTIPNRYGARGDKIYIVDIEKESISNNRGRIAKYAGKCPNYSHLIPDEIKEKATWITHYTTLGDEQAARRKKVEELIETYATAGLVITTRLHVALPCAALNTPCILFHEPTSRFSGYEFLNIYNLSSDNKIEWDPSKIKIPDISHFQNEIKNRIAEWINQLS